MRDFEFRKFLEAIVTDDGTKITDKAINSRISKAKRVENDYCLDLDYVVISDQRMSELSEKLRERTRVKKDHGVYLNTVRKYYEFVNGTKFTN